MTELADPLAILAQETFSDVGPQPADPKKLKRRLLTRIGDSDEYILELDNSSTEKLNTCPRAAEYYLLDRRESPPSSALVFGGAVHRGLEEYYLGRPQNIDKVIYKHFEDNPFIKKDYRTAERACQLLEKYMAQYPIDQEPFKVVEIDGAPGVELPFSVPIGYREVNNNFHINQARCVVDGDPDVEQFYVSKLHFVWIGKIDMVVEDMHGRWWVLDHKTTSIAGPTFFDQFTLSQQMFGYTYAGNYLAKRPVEGLMLNALICRKPTKTGVGFDFARQFYSYSLPLRYEWTKDVMAIGDELIDHLIRGYLPKKTVWCMGKYGACPYYNVCGLNPEQRSGLLDSAVYSDVTWSPLD